MRQVVRRPREELFDGWNTAWDSILRDLIEAQSVSSRFLCLHLTWYQPSTNEFFSPIDLNRIVTQQCRIDNVVVLIDDIYDMYFRLCGDQEIYGQRAMDARGIGFSVLSTRSPSGGDDTLGQERLKLELVESALQHLITWRRTEMFHAENIARSIDADFTILGVKHTARTLMALASRKRTPKIYLSHRISEVRRINKAESTLPDDVGTWRPTAHEVNTLHEQFARRDQLLINPTAIDELRFGDLSDQGDQRAFLSGRWPLISEDAMLSPSTLPKCEHTSLLAIIRGSDVDEIALSVSRSLSSRIYFDIAYRDHIIVEHTAGICVYRPFYRGNASKEADWSGGVRPEISHWYRKISSSSAEVRRAAFVHTIAEMGDRIEWLNKEDNRIEFAKTTLRHLKKILATNGIPAEELSDLDEQINQYLDRRSVGPSHLEQIPDEEIVQLPDFIWDHVELFLGSLDAASLPAFHHTFTMLERPQRQTANADGSETPITYDVLILTADKRGDDRLDGLDGAAEVLCNFFGETLELEDFEALDDTFWQAVNKVCRERLEVDAVEFVCKSLRLPYDALKETHDAPPQPP